jgi:hypothetical protein
VTTSTSGPRSLLTATSARQGNGTLSGLLARDHLHLSSGPAGGRDEHLASGVGVAHLVGDRRAVERHALDLAAGR